MKIEKVETYPDLVKVDKAFVINTNDNLYTAALSRKINAKKLGSIEERVAQIEISQQEIRDSLSAILKFLQPKE